jgi:two-component system sensor histidine kinase KdpD
MDRLGPVARAALTVAGVNALALALGLAMVPYLPPASLSLLFLIAVLLAAVAHGVAAGVAAALLGSLAFNFFFIPPVMTFAVADEAEVFGLLVFVAAGVITGNVAGRMRDAAEIARRRAEIVQSLNDFAGRLSEAASPADVLKTAGEQLAATLRRPSILLQPEGDDLAPVAAWPAQTRLSPGDGKAAILVWKGLPGERPPGVDARDIFFSFRPVAAGGAVEAVLGVGHGAGLAAEEANSFDAVARHAGMAIMRLRHAEAAQKASATAREEQLRNAVLSSVSHDLRTPLATILGSVTTLRELGPSMPEAARQDLLAAIEDEARRLSRFVGNLLDMTRVEAGALAVHPDWIDVADPIRAAVARARTVHASVAFTVAAEPGLPLVQADASLLEQVLFNLLDNAAKYAGTAGPVAIEAAVCGDGLAVSVADSGPGIPAGQRAAVFEKFRRAAHGDAAPAGTGLGLAIARGMAVAMGGDLALESPARNEAGCRFTVRLPCARRDEA